MDAQWEGVFTRSGRAERCVGGGRGRTLGGVVAGVSVVRTQKTNFGRTPESNTSIRYCLSCLSASPGPPHPVRSLRPALRSPRNYCIRSAFSVTLVMGAGASAQKGKDAGAGEIMRLRSVLARDDAPPQADQKNGGNGDEFTNLMEDTNKYARGAEAEGVVLYLEVREAFGHAPWLGVSQGRSYGSRCVDRCLAVKQILPWPLTCVFPCVFSITLFSPPPALPRSPAPCPLVIRHPFPPFPSLSLPRLCALPHPTPFTATNSNDTVYRPCSATSPTGVPAGT